MPPPPPPPQAAQRSSNRLAEALLKSGRVTADQIQKALTLQKEQGGQLGTSLIRLGVLDEPQFVEILSKSFGVPSVSVETLKLEEAIVKLLPADVVRKYTILPIAKNGARITIAMADPTNVFALDDIKFMTGYGVEPVIATETGLRGAIDKYYGSTQSIELKKVMDEVAESGDPTLEVLDDEDDLSMENLEAISEEAPVVRLVNLVLTDAIKRGASDIHVEPYEKELRVRYRIDGLLYEMMHPPLKLREAMTSRVKILAKLDIAEKRLPQDGRIKIKTKIQGRAKDLDYRVSTLPTIFGEKIVMRLLDKDNLMLDLTRLGFEPESLRRFEQSITRPYGMVLVTGPTGSGKTNTLYSALQRVNKPGVNIITAEDPVEFNLVGINQVQMKEQIGLNFATALRSFLRQDPNIILVGEIRDFETAEVAIKAAMTGHLVLSTLAHQRRPFVDQPPDEHGRRALPGRNLGPLRGCPAPGAAGLLLLQGTRARRSRAKHDRHRLFRPRGAHPQAVPWQGLRSLQRHRLQGSNRALRGDGDRGRNARVHSRRRERLRVARQGPRTRHDHASRKRTVQDPRRRDHGRRSPPRNRRVVSKAPDPVEPP